MRLAIATAAGAATAAAEVATAAGIAKAVVEPVATEVAAASTAVATVAVDATIVGSREQAAVAGMACCAGRTEALAQARRRTGRRRNHLDPPHRSTPHYHSCHSPPHRHSTRPAVVGQPLESCPASLRMGSGVASEQPSHSAFVAIAAPVARSGSRGS